jgi:hypothetical protein
MSHIVQRPDHSDTYIASLRTKEIEARDRIAHRRRTAEQSNETDETARAAAQARAEARRASAYRKMAMAIAILVPCAIVYGVWTFAVEPVIHYHSLSVACGAHQYNACQQLTAY